MTAGLGADRCGKFPGTPSGQHLLPAHLHTFLRQRGALLWGGVAHLTGTELPVLGTGRFQQPTGMCPLCPGDAAESPRARDRETHRHSHPETETRKPRATTRQGTRACSRTTPKLKCKSETSKEISILRQRLQECLEGGHRTSGQAGLRASRQGGYARRVVCGRAYHAHQVLRGQLQQPGQTACPPSRPASPPLRATPATLPYLCLPDGLLSRPPLHPLWPLDLPLRHPTYAAPPQA